MFTMVITEHQLHALVTKSLINVPLYNQQLTYNKSLSISGCHGNVQIHCKTLLQSQHLHYVLVFVRRLRNQQIIQAYLWSMESFINMLNESTRKVGLTNRHARKIALTCPLEIVIATDMVVFNNIGLQSTISRAYSVSTHTTYSARPVSTSSTSVFVAAFVVL